MILPFLPAGGRAAAAAIIQGSWFPGFLRFLSLPHGRALGKSKNACSCLFSSCCAFLCLGDAVHAAISGFKKERQHQKLSSGVASKKAHHHDFASNFLTGPDRPASHLPYASRPRIPRPRLAFPFFQLRFFFIPCFPVGLERGHALLRDRTTSSRVSSSSSPRPPLRPPLASDACACRSGNAHGSLSPLSVPGSFLVNTVQLLPFRQGAPPQLATMVSAYFLSFVTLPEATGKALLPCAACFPRPQLPSSCLLPVAAPQLRLPRCSPCFDKAVDSRFESFCCLSAPTKSCHPTAVFVLWLHCHYPTAPFLIPSSLSRRFMISLPLRHYLLHTPSLALPSFLALAFLRSPFLLAITAHGAPSHKVYKGCTY